MGGGTGHRVLSGPRILAVPVAAAAGAVTFLSPCVLPLVPGYLSYVAGMSGVDAQASPAAGDARPAGPGGTAAAGGAAGPGGAAGRGGAAGPAGAAGPGSAAPDVGGSGGGTAVKAPATAVAAGPGRPRTVVGTALFVLGFSAVFATEGVAFGGLGSVLRTHIAGLTQILGGLTILLGVMFAGGVDRLPVTGRGVRPSGRPPGGPGRAPV